VLVEADHHAEVELPGLDRPVPRQQRRPAGGAAVGDVDELDAGEAQARQHGVGVAGGRRAAEPELHVGPLEAGVRQGLARGEDTLVQAGLVVVASERVDACAYDVNVGHRNLPQATGSKA
jgi:hypothetical protein